MANLTELKLLISGEDHLSGPLGAMHHAVTGFGESLAEVGRVAVGFALGGALQAMGGSLAGAFEKGMDTASEFGGEVRKLQREIGGSAESVSSMLVAMERFGLSGDQASTSLGIFSKHLLGVEDAETQAVKGSKSFGQTMKDLGVDFTDTTGHVLPMNDLILKVADRFKEMPNGVEKTALAMQLFGRSGKDMIGFLNQGSEGLTEAMEAAKKYGLTLTGDNLAAVKAYGLAHKDMDEALQGVTLQIGLAFMPVLGKAAEELATLAQLFNTNVVPAIAAFADTLSGPAQAAIDVLGKGFGILGTALDGLHGLFLAFTVDAGGMGIALDAVRSIFGDTVADAIEPFVQAFMHAIPSIKEFVSDGLDTLQRALATVGDAFGSVTQYIHDNQSAADALKTFVGVLAAGFAAYHIVVGTVALATTVWTAAQWLLNAALSANPIGLVIVGLAALAAALVYAYQNSETFRDIVNAAWTDVQAVTAAAFVFITTGLHTLSDLWTSDWGGMASFLKLNWEVMSGLVRLNVEVMKTAVLFGLDLIKGLWTGDWTDMHSLLSTTWDNITSATSSAMATLQSTLGAALQAIADNWQSTLASIAGAIGAWIGETVGSIGAGAVSFGTSLVHGFESGLAGLGAMLQALVHDAVTSIHVDAGPFHLSAGGFRVDAPSMPSISMPSLPAIGGGGGSSAGHAGASGPGGIYNNPATGQPYDDGGVIPGAIGTPTLIMAHAGETVLPTHRFPFAGAPGATGGGIDYDRLAAAIAAAQQPITIQMDGATVARLVRAQLIRTGRANVTAFGGTA